MRVTISSFGGIYPRLSPHSLPPSQASIAHDVRLRDGRLEAWRERQEYTSTSATARSFYVYRGRVYSWLTNVQVAMLSPDDGRIYITGRKPYAEVMSVSAADRNYYRLGIAAPTQAPKASASKTACSRATDARAYVYTYVNQWGEESPPSPVSNILTVDDGASVTVNKIKSPPAGQGIVRIHIYRTATGFRQPDVKQQQPMTDFFFVKAIDASATSFKDSSTMLTMGPALETAKITPPPDDLQNIVAIDGMLRLAGSVGNKIYFSEFNQPQNWPVRYQLTLDSNIIHMGVLNQKLYVTTDTTPYLVDVSNCEEGLTCTPVNNLDTPLPDVALTYQQGAMVIPPYGLIYSTPSGLVLIDPTGRCHILTKLWFSPGDWRKVAPETVRLGFYEGLLFCVTDNVSFVLNLDTDTYGDMKGSELTTISDKPIAMLTSNNGALLMLDKGKIYIWDAGLERRPFTWVSRELTGPGDNQPNYSHLDLTPAQGVAWSPASAKVGTLLTKFTLSSSKEEDVFSTTVTSEEPFRLPRVGRNTWYKVKLQGTHPVEYFSLGTSNFTVNEGK